MKTILFYAGILFLLSNLAIAQTPSRLAIFGNKDGSTIDVIIDSNIKIGFWAVFHSSNDDDSVAFIHEPLASNDSVIVSRDGGILHYPLSEWDEVIFLPPDTNSPIQSYTNQSMLGFCDLGGPRNPFLDTNGDTIMIAEYYMRIANDASLIGQTVCPFMEGDNDPNGTSIWGLNTGTTQFSPTQIYSCLNFVEYFAGDANMSGLVNGLDVTYLVAYLKNIGPAPDPILAGDANGSCTTNGLDVIYLVNYFKGGPEPFLGNCH